MHGKKKESAFGLNEQETRALLDAFGLELNEDVRGMYDGYHMGGMDIYNPWSIINYAKRGVLDNYWVKASANFLVKKGIQGADFNFWDKFEKLVIGESVMVWITLDTSFVERASLYSLWGLLVNAGYLTAVERLDAQTAVIKIPNGEVMAEFQMLLAELSGVDGLDLKQMFSCLLNKDMDGFFKLYQKIIISSTSYMDAKENAYHNRTQTDFSFVLYHRLFLGMCTALRGAYKVTSNLESGHGRSDICLESLMAAHSHVIIELKQGDDLGRLKEEALQQILDKQYYVGLKGEVICVGLAHDKKRCEMAYKTINV